MSSDVPHSLIETRQHALSLADLCQTLESVFAEGGTLRDLFTALVAHPNHLIQGSVFREAFDRYDLHTAFRETFQDPLILERLDSVWVSNQAEKQVIEFRFAQPQSLQQNIRFGKVKLLISSTLTFIINEAGDVTLHPGDIRLRWLMATENLLVRIRRVKTATGTPQDILHISAGHVLSQTTPLDPLRPPVSPAAPLAVPRTTPAPLEPTAVAALVVVIAVLPGRVRFRVVSLYRERTVKERLEKQLARQAGIRRVSANPLTGNLLVLFDPAISLDDVTDWVNRVLDGRGLAELPHTEPDHAPWHLLDQAEIAHFWESSPHTGLSNEVAVARHCVVGPNALPEPQPRPAVAILLDQFKSLPVALLGVSAVLSIFTGGIADGVIILGVVCINAGIGYATEHWAEQSIASLSRGARPNAIIVRSGREREVAGEQLVPGDVIVLKRGMYVPADARLLITEHLTVDESALTGESVPVAKNAATLVERDVPLGRRCNMVYRGTVVTGGSARAIAVATGVSTEVGQIQRMLAETHQPETPLQRQLRMLGGQMVIVSLAICGSVFAIGLLRGQGFLPMLKTAVSLAVAAVPEGLPTVATTTLALGLRRLEQQHVLVRRLVSVETLGALQYVCLDKTGTITINRMTLVSVFVSMTSYHLRGDQFYQDDQAIVALDASDLVLLLQLSALCSEVEFTDMPEENGLKGSPTESALVQAALNAGIDVRGLRERYPLRRTRLRGELRSFMDTLHDDENDGAILAVKGLPSQVLSLCSQQIQDGAIQSLSDADRARITTENERMAGRALRVLGVAYLPKDAVPERDRGLIWVGLAGIADPPRPGMAHLMAQFHQAGIHTMMITGDQSATASAVARDIRLSPDGHLESLDVIRLEELPPDVLRTLAQRVNIFSQVSPAHKLQIVQALQKTGHVVAMTGDGVNDGPALRAADIGIAMGKDGSDVAQEVADMVVRDDNLATIITAIEQGRTIYDDIKKAVHFILSSNASEILTTLITTAAGLGEPLSPMQLLWINLVTDVFPELALGVEPPEDDVMRRAPRDPQAPMFAHGDLQHISVEASLLTASALTAYGWGLARYGRGPRAGTMAFTTLTAAQLLHAISCRSEPHSIFDNSPRLQNPYIPLAVGGGLALQGLVTFTPGLRGILGVTQLGFLDWAVTATTAVTPLFINELIKTVTNADTRQD